MPSRRSQGSPAPIKPVKVLKTLDRALSKAGLGSRTEACEWITQGRVKVNGAVIQTPDHWVNVDRDHVLVDGKPLTAARKLYLLLYKPKGYITTYKDPEGRPTVYDLLKGLDGWVAPVGRLDLDTTGLLILTNDNDFADHLTAPDHSVPKTYLVKTNSILTDEALESLRKGVLLSDGVTRPALVSRVAESGSKSTIELTITEGRNRQVRRMIEAVGSKVRKLVRTGIGPVRIGTLEIGKFRVLTPKEVESLRK